MNDYLARQLQWLGSQCECETLDGVGLCIACGIQITLRRRADDARMMQSLTGEWMWATPLSGITTQTPSSDPGSAEWWRDVAQQLAYQLYHATKGAAMGDSMGDSMANPHKKPHSADRPPQACQNGDCRDHYGDRLAWCAKCASVGPEL